MKFRDDLFGHRSQLGQVCLAGAGPGDPELMTIKVLRRIQTAHAIAYDALLGPEILALIPGGTEQYAVGKRSGDPCATPQESIHFLLLRLAREGKSVLRLKGGDPLVFGRGGEEAQFLHEHGIPVEIVPAVSSVNGAAACAGIPLTHRGLSRLYTVLQGHGQHLDNIAWRALVTQGGTWVFLMSKASVGQIASQLIQHGANPLLPLAVIENASLPDETISLHSLIQAAHGEYAAQTQGPGLVIIGPTVDLAVENQLAQSLTEIHGIALSDISQTAS